MVNCTAAKLFSNTASNAGFRRETTVDNSFGIFISKVQVDTTILLRQIR